ncbi:hypothetical protein GCM10023189_49570 [Nibrella saemangeumensis]|uniref:DUF4468 domain-containing protein n=1 Tax=Nibrella saemangeumensis TaxID=1084526 RepID=A0ABP8NK88_9BACT
MRFLSLLFLLVSTHGVFAQLADTALFFTGDAQRHAIARYEQANRRQSHLYDGNEYINHDPRIKIHPFFPVDSMLVGQVVYDGVHYQSVPMLYDVVRDEIVVKPAEGAYLIRLHANKVDSFSLASRQFVRLVGDSLSGIRPGFYELLHQGKLKALVKRAKYIKEDVSQGFYQANYLVNDRYFVVRDGVYHEVNSKKALLNLFADQKKALRKYLRTNQLRFKQQREQAITGLVREYESLTR